MFRASYYFTNWDQNRDGVKWKSEKGCVLNKLNLNQSYLNVERL